MLQHIQKIFRHILLVGILTTFIFLNLANLTSEKVMARVAYNEKFRGINLAGLEDACWDGYEAIGTKDMDGREVPNCVPISEK